MELNEKQLVELVVKEVLKQLNRQYGAGILKEQNKDTLVILDESPFIEKAELLEQIKWIAQDNRIRQVLSCIENDGQCLAVVNSIEEKFGIVVKEMKSFEEPLQNVLEGIKHIYILGLSISNAAKVCMLVADNPVTRIIQYGLLKGIDMYVDDITCGLDKAAVKKAYITEVNTLRNELSSFGVCLMKEKVWESVNTSSRVHINEIASASDRSRISSTKKKKLISMDTVKEIKGSTFEAGSDMVITPLAVDYLRSRGIRIIYKKK